MRTASRRMRRSDARIAFVPTMGFLHQGHISLIRRARTLADRVVLSIFVNPLQFGPREDLDTYPRDERRDLAIARREGVDLVYLPAAEEIYPPGFRTRVQVPELARRMCGATRPGHFDGVCTVVLKLLLQVEPDLVLLGQKDAQQALILHRMMEDLDLDIRLVVAPTVREHDGLAMSSRNAYLSQAERAQAPAIYAALRAGVGAIAAGERRTARVRRVVEKRLARAPLLKPEYLVLVDLIDLVEHDRIPPQALIAVAARLGRARLIDNVLAGLGGAPPARRFHAGSRTHRHPGRRGG
jgi:pantoate--beta-alanine ligase